jgi:ribose 5-phosphate isomerase B
LLHRPILRPASRSEREAPSGRGAATLAGVQIVFGADHAGYLLKESLVRAATAAGYSVADLGTDSPDPVDYPDFAAAVAREVAGGRAERGVLVCGSGAGASIAANKVRGVRCAVAHDTYTAHQMVEHDDVNVLAVGSRVIGPALAEEIMFAFLGARFTNEERHRRRLDKVIALEEE